MNEASLLLTGANGRTGRHVLQALAAAGVPVRAFIRDPAQAEALLALGATDCAVGDMGDGQSIASALCGCRSLVHIGPPMHPEEITFTRNVIAAAQGEGIEHFIYYSVMHPLRREVRHHRLKLEAEEYVLESDLAYTILQPARYMQHLDALWQHVVDEGVHAMPFSVDQQFSVVDLRDLAEVVARVASGGERHHYAIYELAGPEPLSQRDMAQVLSEELGREVRAQVPDFEAFEASLRARGVDADRVEQMLVMNRHYDRHGFRGNPNVLRWLLAREPQSFRGYVRERQAAR